MSIEKLILKIKRGDSLFYATLKRAIKRMLTLEAPVIKPLYAFLYYERKLRREICRMLRSKMYFEPMVKARCAQCGARLRIIQALPLITGNIHLYLGNDVVIDGYNTFEATSVLDKPVLKVGDNTFIGHYASINVGREVIIGNHCFIAS